MSINASVITGNLTRDPELIELASGAKVCRLRVAVNSRERVDGEWTERANYLDVTVFGGQGEAAARHLAKGRQVAVSGRLRWREWQTEDGGRREAVSITASQVQFLGSPQRDRGAGDGQSSAAREPQPSAAPGADEDELPF